MNLYNPILMATIGPGGGAVDPEIAFNGRMMYFNFLNDRSWLGTDEAFLKISGENVLSGTLALGEMRMLSPGFLKRIRFFVGENTFNKDLDVQLLKDGVPIGNVVFTLKTNELHLNGILWPLNGIASLRLEKGKKYVWRLKTTDGLSVTAGIMSGSIATEIYYGDGIL